MPQTGKIVVVFLPIAFLIMALAISRVVNEKTDFDAVWPSFIGANDLFSDWMLLILIEPSNPWRIFWVALICLVLSNAASIAIAIRFAINTESNPAYIVWLCLTSSTETLKKKYENDDNVFIGIKELTKDMHRFNENYFTLFRSLPMFVVQIVLYFTSASGGHLIDWFLMAEVIMCKFVFCHGS